MPARKERVAAPQKEQIELEDGTFAEIGPDPYIADQTVQDVIEEHADTPGEVRVSIARYNPTTRSFQYLPSIPGAEYSTDRVAALYGGGKYQMRVFKGKKYLYSVVFSIDESVRPSATPTLSPSPATPAPVTDQSALVTVIQQLLRRLDQIQAPVAPPPREGFREHLSELREIMEIIRGSSPGAPATGLKDQLELANQLADLGKKLVGEGGGGEVNETVALINAAKEIGLPVLDILKERVALERGTRGLPAPNPEPTPAAPTPEAADTMEPWMKELSGWIPAAVAEAQRGLPAESFAAYMVDRLSDATYDKLVEIAAAPGAVDQIITLVPALAPHRGWVTEWLVSIAESEAPPEEPPAPTGTPN